MRDQLTSRRGLSLTDVLVTIAATAILTGLLLFGIRAVRGQTLAMKDLHNLRLSVQDMHLWSTDNDDILLNLGTELPGLWNFMFGSSGPEVSDRAFPSLYWGQHRTWNGTLARLTGNAHRHWQSVYGPYDNSQSPVAPPPPSPGTAQYAASISRIAYSPTFLTNPSAWDGNREFRRISDLEPFFAVVRRSQVASPSAKGLFLNQHLGDDSGMSHAGYVDGSAERRHSTRYQPAAAPPTSHDDTLLGIPVLHTRHGHLGRDR